MAVKLTDKQKVLLAIVITFSFFICELGGLLNQWCWHMHD